jgi:hypothetical protein
MALQFLDFPNSFLFFKKSNWCVISKEVEELESPNSRTFGELKLHEMLLTLGMESPMPGSLSQP